MDILATIKGQPDGTGQGLTTYPTSPDPDKQAAHSECLKLEKEGKIVRHVDNDGQSHGHGAPFVIWRMAPEAPSAKVTGADAPDDETDAHN